MSFLSELSLRKQAKNVSFDVAGPAGLEHALPMLYSAKSLVTPQKKYLREKGLSQDAFNEQLNLLATRARDSENFKARELLPNPVLSAVLPTLLGGGAGLAAGSYVTSAEHPTARRVLQGAGALLGAGAGAGWGYMAHRNRKRKMLATLKILREYGINNPKKFYTAKPLLEHYDF